MFPAIKSTDTQNKVTVSSKIKFATMLVMLASVAISVSACKPVRTEDGYYRYAKDREVYAEPLDRTYSKEAKLGTYKEMKTPKGLKMEKLFSHKTFTDEERFSRLEFAVIELEKQVNALAGNEAEHADYEPVKKEMKYLVDETRELAKTYAPPKKESATFSDIVSATAMHAHEGAESSKAPASGKENAPTLLSVRAGVHDNFTRLVFDLNQNTRYRVDPDQKEGFITIEFPDAEASSKIKSQKLRKSKYVYSYEIQRNTDNKGSLVVVIPTNGSHIIAEKVIPKGSNPNYRLYIDIGK